MGRTKNTQKRDFITDALSEKSYKQVKKDLNERSEFSDEMASLYGKYVNLAIEMLKFDRTHLNIEVVNKNISEDKNSDRYGPFIKPKGKCFTSSALCSEHFRKFEFKGSVKDSDGKTVVKSMVMKVVFNDFTDKNGNPSPRMRGLVKGIYGLRAEKVVVELSRIMQFCRFFLETMKDMIDRFYGRNSSEYKFYKKCYAKIDRLNSKYRKLVKDFSKRAHTDTVRGIDSKMIKDSEKLNFFETNKGDITSTYEERVAGWEVKLQKIKEMIKNFNNIVKANTYTNSVNLSIKELNTLSKKVQAKYNNRFDAIIEKAENEEGARKFIDGFKKEGSKSFYSECVKKVNENNKILGERSKAIVEQQEKLKKYILNKEQLNNEAKRLEGKSDEEKLKFYTDRLSAMKECLRDLNETHRLCNRAVENVNNALIEMNNLTNTKEWKDWIKDEVKPMLKGHGKMFKLEREIRKRDKNTKIEARQKAAEEKAAEEKAADEKAAEEKAADEKAADEKAADEKAAAEKAAKEEEAKRKAAEKTAAANPPSDEAVPAGDSSSSSSADLPEGGAPSTEPLPE